MDYAGSISGVVRGVRLGYVPGVIGVWIMQGCKTELACLLL